jgi:hypothetical protein
MTRASAQHDSFKLAKLSILRHKSFRSTYLPYVPKPGLLHQPALLAESDNYNVENHP